LYSKERIWQAKRTLLGVAPRPQAPLVNRDSQNGKPFFHITKKPKIVSQFRFKNKTKSFAKFKQKGGKILCKNELVTSH